MATVTRQAQAEIELDRVVSRIDATARDAGHQVGLWDYYDDGAASLRCGACRAEAAVRVYPDGRVWSAGRLRLDNRCPKENS